MFRFLKFQFLAVLGLLSAYTHAQEYIQYSSLFWTNQARFNPGATGLDGKFFGALSTIKYLPYSSSSKRSYQGLVTGKVEPIHGTIGLYGSDMRLGWNQFQQLGVQYAYGWKLGNSEALEKQHRFRLGLAFDFTRVYQRGYIAGTQKPSTILIPIAPDINRGYDASVGLTYQFQGLVAGFAVNRLVNSDFETDHLARSYWFHAQYDLALSPKLRIRPGAIGIVSSDYRGHSILQASVIGYWKDTYWLGVTRQWEYTSGVVAGLKLAEKYRLAYSFDYHHSRYPNNFVRTHELVLSFLLE